MCGIVPTFEDKSFLGCYLLNANCYPRLVTTKMSPTPPPNSKAQVQILPAGVHTIFVFRFSKVHSLHGFTGDTTEALHRPTPQELPSSENSPLPSQRWAYSSVWHDFTMMPLVDRPDVVM